ncbi:allantoate deiminase [Bacillota bacterium Lsc_1132]
MIEWLSSFGQTENGGVTRLLYSENWKRAQTALKHKMEQIGLEPYFDSVGNLFGRLRGSDPESKTILTGSHLDTVVDGGKYDGAYGIMASFLAVGKLIKLYGIPRKTIEVVSLCEEEGSRFPLAFWGSRNIQGVYSLTDVITLKDAEGVRFLDAMKQAGFSPEAYTAPKREDIERFIEVHIEQGSILEKSGNSLGIVSDIVGQRRYTVMVTGESNHAGTTPMNFRKDALCVMAEFVSYLTKKAAEMDPQLVATVGKVTVKPNVPNVIAGEAEFSLDIRHHQEQILNRYCSDIFAFLDKLTAELEMSTTVTNWMNVKPVKMDRKMNEVLQKIAEKKKIATLEMVSGAGHDAQVFGDMCPTSLLFVPSRNGISHSPKEFTSVSDLEIAIEVLSELLYQLAY